MSNYHKGLVSKTEILTDARRILNEKGIGLTVELLAKELGLSRGKITHFFPTKDSIMVGIMRDYEYHVSQLIHEFEWDQSPTFDNFFAILERILDLQYEFRCSISYLSSIGKSQTELLQHIESSFFNRIEGIRLRLQLMVNTHLLSSKILETGELEVYLFQYTTLLTTWVICQDLYYSQQGYATMKPIYIKAAMNLFKPYLTEKGKKAYNKTMADYESRYEKK